MFDLTIISPQRIVFEGAVNKVWLDGDDSEYELLSFHAHIIGVLREGKIIINDNKGIFIKKGIVQFYENKCMILVDEAAGVIRTVLEKQ